MDGIAGKVALVTGAGRGIGKAIAGALARAGALVMLSDVVEGAARETIAQLEEEGFAAAYIGADVSREADVAAMVSATVARFDGLDIAINNAGILPEYGAIADLALEEWNRGLSVNLTGVFLCMKHQMVHMRNHGGGAIVNISSIGAIRGRLNLSAYAASKRGVLALTSCGAVEGAEHGIRVNAILPGAIETEMLSNAVTLNTSSDVGQRVSPMKRSGVPDEIADAVVWLSSSNASFVTGQSIAVDGGATAG